MNDERRELALKLRVGVFVLVALAVFLGMVYALGARARLFEARYTVHADFGEVGGLTEGATVRLAGVQIARVIRGGADAARNVAALVVALRQTVDSVNRTQLVDKLGRVVDRVERGPGWAHALLYEEPVALRRLNQLLTTTQALLERVAAGQGAAGVLVSPEGTAPAKRFVAAMDRLGRLLDRPGLEEGLLPALLFDPKYRATLDDLRAVAHNLRGVSDRLAGGRGTLGALLAEGDEGAVRAAGEDLRGAVANLKAVSGRLEAGEGTLGGLLADPTIYERLVAILEGAQRSFLLRSLIRGLGREPAPETTGDAPKR